MLRPLKDLCSKNIFNTKFELEQVGSKTDVSHFNNEVRNLRKYPFIRIFHRWSQYGDISIDGNEWDEGTYDFVVTPNSKIIPQKHPIPEYGPYRTAFKIDSNYNIRCMSQLGDNSDDSIIIFGFIEKKLHNLIKYIKNRVYNLIDNKEVGDLYD